MVQSNGVLPGPLLPILLQKQKTHENFSHVMSFSMSIQVFMLKVQLPMHGVQVGVVELKG